jgi:hypothetical protein
VQKVGGGGIKFRMGHFRYAAGELVLIGDIVRQLGHAQEERIAMILAPKSELAEHFSCGTTGGVMIEPSRIMLHVEDVDWSEWELVRRSSLVDD